MAENEKSSVEGNLKCYEKADEEGYENKVISIIYLFIKIYIVMEP